MDYGMPGAGIGWLALMLLNIKAIIRQTSNL